MHGKLWTWVGGGGAFFKLCFPSRSREIYFDRHHVAGKVGVVYNFHDILPSVLEGLIKPVEVGNEFGLYFEL